MGKHKAVKARKRLHTKRREANQKRQSLHRKDNLKTVVDEEPQISMV